MTNQIKSLLVQLEKTTLDLNTASSWRNLVLSKLFSEMLREISRFEKAIGRADDSGINLSARNIFELHIMILHIFHNPEIAGVWLSSASGNDIFEVIEGLKKLAADMDIDDNGELNRIEATMREDMNNQNFNSRNNIEHKDQSKFKGKFNMKKCAEEHGHENAYAYLYKFASKFIHPSSYKINICDGAYSYNWVTRPLGVKFIGETEKLASIISQEIASNDN